jgi:hypothetical protein
VKARAAALALLFLAAIPARADDAPSPAAAFDPPQYVTISGYKGDIMEPFLSRDGQTLFFNNLNDPSVNTDIFYATRVDTLHFAFQGPVDGVNTDRALEGVPSMDRAGNFYFISPREYNWTLSTVWTGPYDSGRVDGARLAEGDLSLGAAGWFVMDAEISADGYTLYATDNHRKRFGGGPPDTSLFFLADRIAPGRFRRSQATAFVMRLVNDPAALQYAAATSDDERTLYFTRYYGATDDMGIWVSTRAAKTDPWGAPERITAIKGASEAPTVTPDNCGIYFHRREIDGHFHLLYAGHATCGGDGR